MADVAQSAGDDEPERNRETEAEGERLTALLKSHALQIFEHCESVQIVATLHKPDRGTRVINWGEGNYFARYGSAKEWVVKQEEQMRVEQRPE